MTPNRVLDQLVGEQLSSVEFVQDYLQLHFDGPTINVMTPITVSSAQHHCRSDHDGFRNAICKQIAKRVSSVSVVGEQSLDIVFTDQSRISISLEPRDYTGAEAVYYSGFKDQEWGVI